MEKVLEVKNLRTYYFTYEGVLKAVDNISYSIGQGQTLGIIGESGCGKSAASNSILRIVPPPGRIVGGQILLYDPKRPKEPPVDLVKMDPKGKEIREIRGSRISMIFQEPMTSLSPLHTVGNQIMEAILLHQTKDKKEAEELAYEMLVKVGIGNPRQRLLEYPHQLSGGIRQRVMIAMALSCHPSLLIADEPTTALDVTVQAQVLELMKNLQQELGMSIQYITHDLGVIADVANHVAVMYLGRIVEMGTREQIFKNPLHPYTDRLMKSIPSLKQKRDGGRLESINGTVPIPINLPASCGFCSRCPVKLCGLCEKAYPKLVDRGEGHYVSCFLYGEEAEEPVETDAGNKHKKERR
ncbi:ABC transporter ATP-binding protein [Lachnotalea sp. AF33-28]|jgi:peptide/nickel transport system ATP-binding protein|uniref:ABC transporter ATP-binding protein n=1 Tax=Lachnotalea sp. AF33-28 TaxID=2292046 RepID=UPI000E5203FC|nr:ABC transporter ATP-binding protein [Lachnotalea sp. AF33-28]RHP35558.1 ABC transporter ATP-binding protein [Lachnotalea sp. AF33-28]